MKSKKLIFLNWIFSIFCFLGFFVYFGTVSSFLFLLIGIVSMPIEQIRQWFGRGASFRIAIIAIGFVVACVAAPAADKNQVSSEPLPVVASTASSTSAEMPKENTSAIVAAGDESMAVPSSISQVSSSEPEELDSAVPPENSTFQVDFFDVGQADAALVECDGHHMLIDGGNVADSSLLYSYLQNRGIQHLDYVVGTHPHEDHVGGLAGALSYASADVVYSPVLDYEGSNAFTDFKAKADENGGLQVPVIGERLPLGSATVEILGVNAGENVNDASIVLKITYGNTSFLFTGDAEYAAEQALMGQDLSATVLKVGHHGSDTSTSYLFLREVMPQYAVISAAQDNLYDHPNEAVLSRLRDADVKVYRTDMQGNITCISDGERVTVIPAKNADADTNPTATDGSGQKSVEAPKTSPGQYIGNLNSHKFHRVSCSSLPKEKNRIYFDSREEAINSGYVPCKRCNP